MKNDVKARYCNITQINSDSCSAYLELNKNDGYRWMLAFVKSGIFWGLFDDAGKKWKVSHSEALPKIKSELIEIRFFGETSELMIWQDVNGFAGRVIADTEDKWEKEDPFRPCLERRILFGDRYVENVAVCFTTVGDARGAQQTLPFILGPDAFKSSARADASGRSPLRLQVKNYFAQCPASGMSVNIVSRLVSIAKAGENE